VFVLFGITHSVAKLIHAYNAPGQFLKVHYLHLFESWNWKTALKCLWRGTMYSIIYSTFCFSEEV